MLLAETKRVKEAEICLLTLLVQEPRWAEGNVYNIDTIDIYIDTLFFLVLILLLIGWAVLYLFYKEIDNVGGLDLAKEMALKYLDDPRSPTDEFMKIEDLAWTFSICPNTLYFRASVILLKMRIYSV